MQYLMPLHLFLQRRIAREALSSAIEAVITTIDSRLSLELAHMKRCQLTFAIVLETITECYRLELQATSSPQRGLLTNQSEPRRDRLQQIMQSLSNVLTRREVLDALEASSRSQEQ